MHKRSIESRFLGKLLNVMFAKDWPMNLKFKLMTDELCRLRDYRCEHFAHLKSLLRVLVVKYGHKVCPFCKMATLLR